MIKTTTNKETTTWEVITPQKAQEYLAMNKNNRKLMSRVVDSYAQDLKDGKWIIGTSTICFDINGNLIDGQHRLSAIIKAGISVRMEVKRNLSEDAFKAMDIGKVRQPKDMFNIAGVSNYQNLSGVIRATLQFEQESFVRNTKRMSNPELWEIYNMMPDKYDEACKIGCTYYSQFKDISVSFWGAMYLHLTLTKKHSSEKVLRFFDELSDKISTENDTLRLFRKKLRNMRELSDSVSRSPVFLTLLIRTWNAWVTNNNRAKLPLQLKEGEELWFI